jgi:hypothetical protein
MTYNPHSTSKALCKHARSAGTVSIGNLDRGPHASVHTCRRPNCIANCARWAAKQTGIPAWKAEYRPFGGDGTAHSALQLAAALARNEATR